MPQEKVNDGSVNRYRLCVCKAWNKNKKRHLNNYSLRCRKWKKWRDKIKMLRKLYTNFKLFDFIQEQSLKLIRDLLLN